jgi:HlyD family secretion protein
MAQRELERMRLQGAVTDVVAAESKLQQLGLQLAQAETTFPVAEVVSARVELARAHDTLEAAQIGYREALDRPWEPQRVRDAHVAAVTEAERSVQLSRARLDSALNAQGAHALDLEMLEAQRSEMEAQLARALDAQAAYSVTLSLLAAEVALAQQRVEGLKSWTNPYLDPPSPGPIAQARAELRQAELTVAQLEWHLRGAELRAPFDGIVAAIYLSPGEWCTVGEPAIGLLDTTNWEVETRNVGELAIGRVRVGQEARVEVIAFRGQELQGKVVAISPIAVVQQGDTTYTLLIELEPTDLNLRPGMNAEVEILTD